MDKWEKLRGDLCALCAHYSVSEDEVRYRVLWDVICRMHKLDSTEQGSADALRG